MKTPLWEASTGALLSLLNSSTFVGANLVTIAFNSGREYRPLQITTLLGEQVATAWKADSSSLLYNNTLVAHDTGTYIVGNDGLGPTFLTDFGGVLEPSDGVSCSPDGTRFVVNGSGGGHDGLWVTDIDGTGTVRIFNDTADNGVFNCNWGSNDKITFVRPILSDISQINPDGTGLAQIANITDGSPYSPRWSPDATEIAYLKIIGSDPYFTDIWKINADGTGDTRLTNFNFDVAQFQFWNRPAWTADGNHIVFTANDTPSNTLSGPGIWIMNSDGTNQHKILTTFGRNSQDAQMSPDNNWISYVVTNGYDGAYAGLWVVKLAQSLKMREAL